MNTLIQNGQYNIGYLCTGRICEEGKGDRCAFRFISSSFKKKDYSFNDLNTESNRVASALQNHGIKKGDIVFTYLPKIPEQFFIFLGTLKNNSTIGTLFSNFGPDAVFDRLNDSSAKILFTKEKLYKKISSIISKLPNLKLIVLVDSQEEVSLKVISYKSFLSSAKEIFDVPLTSADTPSVIHYTSGSTGKPKGVVHAHRSILMHQKTGKEILKMKSGDIYWCTADQGWVTGTSYGIIAPWILGLTQIHYEGAFNAKNYFKIIQDENITLWYTAPTLLRMLMAYDENDYSNYDLTKLKYIFSVGEPLNAEIYNWGKKVLGKEIYDTYFQTETGAIMIANRPDIPVKPGSMGKPVSTITAQIISKHDFSNEKAGIPGYLCLKKGWDSMFTGYLNNPEVYENKFRNGWYFTGDEAKMDDDGYFWFMGRSDDVINTAGHLISPFEIESALLELPEVIESAAIGVPDPLLWEKIIVFINDGNNKNKEDIEMLVRLHLSNKLSTIATPSEIIFLDIIPKNKSGKIMRRILKAKYLGLELGDISTLDEI